MTDDCIFCKIVVGKIPSEKVYESDNIFVFMDINPLSEGHCLFIPKKHAATLHETDDASLAEIPLIIKKVTKALDIDTYNILQNNGTIAHQAVAHTHFHLIPKPSADLGLKMEWDPQDEIDQEEAAEKIRNYMN